MSQGEAAEQIVNAVNRIAERFALSTVDVERIREEITKSRKEREGKKEPAEKAGERSVDPFDLVFGAPAPKAKEETKADEEPAVIIKRDGEENVNPTLKFRNGLEYYYFITVIWTTPYQFRRLLLSALLLVSLIASKRDLWYNKTLSHETVGDQSVSG